MMKLHNLFVVILVRNGHVASGLEIAGGVFVDRQRLYSPSRIVAHRVPP